MTKGKARVMREREVDQMRFDEYLIDAYTVGDPPDELDRRAIPVVYGADRLARAAVSDDSTIVESDGEAEVYSFDPDDSAVHPTLIPLRDKTEARRDPKSDERVVEETGDQKRIERAPTLNVTPPIVTRAIKHPRIQDRVESNVEDFRWSGFLTGAALGGLAGAAVLALVSLI